MQPPSPKSRSKSLMCMPSLLSLNCFSFYQNWFQQQSKSESKSQEQNKKQGKSISYNPDQVKQQIKSSKEKIVQLKNYILNKQFGFIEKKFGCEELKKQLFKQLDNLLLQMENIQKINIKIETNELKNNVQLILRSGRNINAKNRFQTFLNGVKTILSLFQSIFSEKYFIAASAFMISRIREETLQTAVKASGITFAVTAVVELAYTCLKGSQTKKQWIQAIEQVKKEVKKFQKQHSQIIAIREQS